jgi:hypothetical protein
MRKLTNTLSPISFTLSLLLLATLFSAAQGQGLNMLHNGSFEEGSTGLALTKLSGWRVLAGNVDVLSDYVVADGSNYLDLIGTPGIAAIEQAFPTVIGQKYVLSGWVAHHHGITRAGANITVNGEFLEPLFHTGQVIPTNLQWTRFTRTFIAKCSTTILRFADVNLAGYVFGGTLLDGLSVNAQAAEGEIVCDRKLCFKAPYAWHYALQVQRNRNYSVNIPGVNFGLPVDVFSSGGVNPNVTMALEPYSQHVRYKLTAAYVAAQLSLQEQITFWWHGIGTLKLGCFVRMPMNSTPSCTFPVLLGSGEKLDSNSSLADLFNQTERAFKGGTDDELQTLLNIYNQLDNCRND